MNPAEDYYALLGIDEKADDAELRRVWRRLARRWHPDHAGPGATAGFQKISAAYAVLCDPVARAAYDSRRAAERPRNGAVAPAKTGAVRRRAPSVMLSRVSGPLDGLLACGVARRINDNLIELVLSPAEAKEGGMIKIAMRVAVRSGGKTTDEVFSAWLAVPPEIVDGAVLVPSALLPGMVHPVRFQVRVGV